MRKPSIGSWRVLAVFIGSLLVLSCQTPAPTATAPPSPTATIPATQTRVPGTPVPTPTLTPIPTSTPRPPGPIPGSTFTLLVPTLGGETWCPALGVGGYDTRVVTAAITERFLTVRNSLGQVGNYGPGLIEGWQWEGTKNLTLKLVRNAQYNDPKYGNFKAADFVNHWALAFDANAATVATGDVRRMIGASADEVRRNMQIVDDYTVAINFPNPIYPPELFSLFNRTETSGVMPKALFDEKGPVAACNSPVGTGPFKLEKHERGQQVVAKAVPNHWRKSAQVETLSWQIVPELATQLAILASGRGDAAIVPPSAVQEAQRLKLEVAPAGGAYNAYFIPRGNWPSDQGEYGANLPWVDGDHPESARKVRYAMALAIDRESIAKNLYFGLATPARMFESTGPGDPWHDNLDPIPYDVAQAKRLLAEAGYSSGFSIRLMSYQQAGREIGSLAEVVASNLGDIGIKVEVVPTEWGRVRSDVMGRLKPTEAHIQPTMATSPNLVTQFQNLWNAESTFLWATSKELTAYNNQTKQRLIENPEQSAQIITEFTKTWRDTWYAVPVVVIKRMMIRAPNRIDSWPMSVGDIAPNDYEYITLKLAQ